MTKKHWAEEWSPGGEVLEEALRIVHLGDLHYGRRWLRLSNEKGVNIREQDIYDSGQYLLEQLRHDQPHLICLVGDIFNTMEPTPLTFLNVEKLVMEMRKIAPVIITAGNHDHKRSHRTTPLLVLRELYDCELALNQTYFDYEYDIEGHKFDRIRLHLLPYVALENDADEREPLQPQQWTGNDIMCAHAYAYGKNVATPPEHILIPESLVNEPRFGRVLLGHIHQHVQLDPGGKAYYSGPLQPLDFGEIDVVPGYWLHNQMPTGEWVTQDRPLPYRPFHKIAVSQGELTMDEFNQILIGKLSQMDVQDSVMKLVVSDCDPGFRGSALPVKWSETFEENGGLFLSVDFISKDGGELLETEYTEVSSKLDEMYFKHITENSSGLLGKAKEIWEVVQE